MSILITDLKQNALIASNSAHQMGQDLSGKIEWLNSERIEPPLAKILSANTVFRLFDF